MRARKICIMRIVDFGQFWPIFAQKCFSFRDGKFFPVMGNTWKFQGSISTIYVQPNFPIIILTLLNGFDKFQRSMGLNNSELMYTLAGWVANVSYGYISWKRYSNQLMYKAIAAKVRKVVSSNAQVMREQVITFSFCKFRGCSILIHSFAEWRQCWCKEGVG